MKSKRKRGKVKSKKQLLGKRLTYVFVAIAAILSCFLIYFGLNLQNPTPVDKTPKAAIVDHLSISQPNNTFSQTIQALINETGLEVDYYPGEEVTVDFYRNLPLHNYKLILFRVHSTGECTVEDFPPFIVFFSSEEYSNMKHVSDQLATQLVYVNFPEAEPPGYFGITPLFITDRVNGRFNDTIIVAMGCDGLKHTTMAEAFIEKGAKVYIGWNGPVAASHTDKATTCLLRKLITEKQCMEEAVNETMKEVGPDPVNESILAFYPETAASHNIPLNTYKIDVEPEVISMLLKKAFQRHQTSRARYTDFPNIHITYTSRFCESTIDRSTREKILKRK